MTKRLKREHIRREYEDEFEDEEPEERSCVRPDIGNVDHIDAQPEPPTEREVDNEQV